MQCEKTKPNGTRCCARALNGKKLCAFHADPRRAAELGRKGGRRRAIYNFEEITEFTAPRTTADLRDLLAQAIVETRAGRLDPRVANAVSCLSGAFLRTSEVIEVEERLRRLEAWIDDARQVLAQPGAEGKRAN